ncbi:MAG: L-2-hydroxyglutarate oxidase [Thermogemmata sp.]|nr:L-2-hydroxyglutarate oxidase [Gemmataceae bacterium]
MEHCDLLVVGGGIVGLAAAWTLRRQLHVLVIEAEKEIASHQTGHNSGVIHSGLYYRPGSIKARLCVRGRELLYRFCAEYGVPHERCGKLVVAVQERELPRLAELERRGRANGLEGLQYVDAAKMRQIEPHVRGVAALHIPHTGIVSYPAVAEKLRQQIHEAGGQVQTQRQFVNGRPEGHTFHAETTQGPISARLLLNCAGLYSDRVAAACGVRPSVQIIPFRGEYYRLKPTAEHLCRNLIYPVPDPKLPFLGVHFTRMIRGGVECGPNAVLAFQRTGYRIQDVSGRDLIEMLLYPGFWRLACRFWRTGLDEMRRSLSPAAFCAAARRMVPELHCADLEYAGAGVRAQAVDPQGRLVDDFVIQEEQRMIHVLNAPSPAATASLAIGEYLAERILHHLRSG